MDYKEIFGDLSPQIEAIVKEKGVNLIVDNKENPTFIPKTRFDEIIGSKNELKSQVGELTNQLETLKKASKGNEELTKKIEELQKSNGDWESKYRESNIKSQIKLLGVKEKAKDTDDLVRFLDIAKLDLDETGNIKGLDEQLKTLKESNPYLFDTEQQEPKPNPTNGVNPPASNANVKSLPEQIAAAELAGNTLLAIKLKNQQYKI